MSWIHTASPLQLIQIREIIALCFVNKKQIHWLNCKTQPFVYRLSSSFIRGKLFFELINICYLSSVLTQSENNLRSWILLMCLRKDLLLAYRYNVCSDNVKYIFRGPHCDPKDLKKLISVERENSCSAQFSEGSKEVWKCIHCSTVLPHSLSLYLFIFSSWMITLDICVNSIKQAGWTSKDFHYIISWTTV